jgi:hypothetical protein
MEWLDQGWNYVRQVDPQVMAGAIAMLLIISITSFWHRWDTRRTGKKLRDIRSSVRGRWMVSPERENYLKILMSDGITDVIEELVHIKKMTTEEAIIWYRRFGNLLNLPDLLSKHEKTLKEQLRKASKGKVIPFPDLASPPSNGGNGLIKMKAFRPHS